MRPEYALRRCTFHSSRRHALCAYSRQAWTKHGSRYATTAASEHVQDISKTRNIGIIAHIDAGKTTTTERMLFYSGHTRRIGNVDDGSTVTDFLPAERERGVTIQSAAISFNWPPTQVDSAPIQLKTADSSQHNVNLIDTPGHADFTFEVLRSLRILDGAVCILDGVAGVEAQTEKVWQQAARYDIPKIVYINKLDREGASFANSVKDVASKLHSHPAVCQIPWWQGGSGQFCGVGDPINLRAICWSGGDGTKFEIIEMDQLAQIDERFHAEIFKARGALVELLIGNEDEMLEKFLEVDERPLAISSGDIIKSLRKLTLDPGSSIVPVFAGASFQNIGVQTLLDAIVHFLPSPIETREAEVSVGGVDGTLSRLMSGELLEQGTTAKSNKKLARSTPRNTALIRNLESCALAFKVVHDPRLGTLIYVRVYAGSIRKSNILFNTNLQLSERCPQLLKMYASESTQVDEIPAGQIGVIPGLKHTRTGDTLVSYKDAHSKAGPPHPLNTLQLRPIEVPPTMFMASVEPRTLSDQKPVQAALDLLTREDPSLQVHEDEESQQTLLSGMGEFHLEIAQDRLINYYKAKASMGKAEIAYREALLESSGEVEYLSDQEKATKSGMAGCIASVEPTGDHTDVDAETDMENTYTAFEEGNRITVRLQSVQGLSETSDRDGSISTSKFDISSTFNALKNGAMAALARGINYGFHMHDTHVELVFDTSKHFFAGDTTNSALSSAARLATKAALRKAAQNRGSALLELIMDVSVSVDEASLGAVVNDLSSARGGHVLLLGDDSDDVAEGVDAGIPSEMGANSSSTAAGGVGQSYSRRQPKIDLSQVYTPPDPFESSDRPAATDNASDTTRQRTIKAKVPLKEMIGYLKYLRSLTAGRGNFVMTADKFAKVVGQREKNLIKELRGGL